MSERKKIIVIADDFTGAAEIGGIGLRHGLNVAIETEPVDSDEIDLLVMATDTRSMNIHDASLYVKSITSKLNCFKHFFIYKKIDSVLRGNITEEIVAQLEEMNIARSIIIAGNPVFNRVIKDGKYFVDGVELNNTCFSKDSQHPIQTNDVLKVLSVSNEYPVVSRKVDDDFPEKGLIMGDVESIEDLHKWTLKFTDNILFAGASGFFNSLLSSLKLSKPFKNRKNIPFGKKVLFVHGSSYPKDELLLRNMKENGHYHSNMPAVIYNNAYSEDDFNDWVEDVVSGLKNYRKVIVSSIHSGSKDPDIFKRIKKEIAELVKRVCDRTKLDEILIEGGSTTSEVLDRLEIKRLTPLQELDTGVIRMQVDSQLDLCITTKPGSYLWPENVWLNSKIEQLNANNLMKSANYE